MFDEDKCGFQHKLEVERHRKNIEKLERKLLSEDQIRLDAMSRRSDILYRAFSALHERERTATHETHE